MRTHTVNHPFMCREGQFEEGKRHLCIGLDINALSTTDTYVCYLGKNRETKYKIDSSKALQFAEEHNSTWKNPKGRSVAIIPIYLFEKIDSGRKKEVVQEPIPEPNIPTQEKLL